MNKANIDFLGRLVGAESVSSKDPAINHSNAKAASEVATMLEDAGLQVEIRTVPNLPDKHNVVAYAGPDEEHAGLLLAGHTDTVPYDSTAWTTDPLVLTERNGILHGLGACDMKGFFAVIAEALEHIDLKALRAPLRIWATAEEECGMEGAMHLAKTASASKVALVGEPTSVVPVYGHKGALAEKIICYGKSGHASIPAAGANALEGIAQVMMALRSAIVEQAKHHHILDFNPPTPTLNFGRCVAGDSFNRIPDRCELWVDRRLVPGEKVAEVRDLLHQTARTAIADMPGLSVEFAPIVNGFEAVMTPREAPIVAAAVRITGHQPCTVAYATEAPFYAAAGMDVLIMGAGDIAVAHQPNEGVALTDLDAMTSATCQLIDKFCLTA